MQKWLKLSVNRPVLTLGGDFRGWGLLRDGLEILRASLGPELYVCRKLDLGRMVGGDSGSCKRRADPVCRASAWGMGEVGKSLVRAVMSISNTRLSNWAQLLRARVETAR